MSAPKPTKAGKFADDAEAIGGWDVERDKLPDGYRAVYCERGDESFELEWQPGTRGLKLIKCVHFTNPEPDAEPEYISGPAEVLRLMALHPAANGSRLPFKPDDDEKTVLAAVAGHKVYWRNSITGSIEDGTVPRGGMHLTVTSKPDGRRVLNFADTHVTGFRSVHLDAITKVS